MTYTRFLLPAEIEMLEAAVHYGTQVEGLGTAFLASVESAVQDIAERPGAWPPVGNGIRKRQVYRFPYAVLYRIDPLEIVIVAVMHQRRRPGYWLARVGSPNE